MRRLPVKQLKESWKITSTGSILSQLTQFPLAKNDDGPDALEMAMQVVQIGPARVGGFPDEAVQFCNYLTSGEKYSCI